MERSKTKVSEAKASQAKVSEVKTSRTKVKQKSLTLILVLALIAQIFMPVPTLFAQAQPDKGMSFNAPTVQALRQYYKSYTSSAELTHDYYGLDLVDVSEPSTLFEVQSSMEKPYNKGKLKQAALDDTLHLINTMRYQSGLTPVKLTAARNELAQASAFITNLNGTLSHNPDVPNGMTKDDPLYKQGYQGSSESNIGLGHSVLSQVIGYMRDSSSAFNREVVGHRRWLLHQDATEFGVGYTGSGSAIHIMDQPWSEDIQTQVLAWPHTTFSEFMDSQTPLTTMIGRGLDISNATVDVTNINKGITNHYSKAKNNLTIGENYYGPTNVLVFGMNSEEQLQEEYEPGTQLRVKVNNVKDRNTGKVKEIEYTINFGGINDDNTRYTPEVYRYYIRTESYKAEPKYIEDPSLAPGQEVLEKRGKLGQRQITIRVGFRGEVQTSTKVLEEEILTEAIPDVIRRGPEYKTQTITKKEVIKYKTTEVLTDKLEVGQTKVQQKGQNGERTITVRQTIDSSGKIINETILKSEVTKKPVEEIILRGIRKKPVITYKKDTVYEDIKFNTEYVDSDKLYIGEEEVQQEGKLGKALVTTTITLKDGQEIDRTTSRTVEQEPVTQIILKGTKRRPVVTYQEHKETKIVEFEEITELTDKLYEGETEVKQEGKTGEETYTYKIKYVDGKATDKELISKELTKEPINKIILKGTKHKPVITFEEHKETQEVKYQTEIRETNDLFEDEQEVLQEGKNGINELVYKVKYIDGKEDSRELVETNVINKVQNKIILKGTKHRPVITYNKHTEIKDVDFETEYINSDELYIGEQEVVQEGKLGKAEVTTTIKLVDGEAVDTTVNEVITVKPENRIIKVGTKERPGITYEEIEITKDIDFDIEKVNDDTLYIGETKVKQQGKLGQRKLTYKVSYKDGVKLDETLVSDEVVKEPVKEIILVGTKPLPTTITETVDKEIEFDIIKKSDNSLFEGETKLFQEGQKGIKRYTYEITKEADGTILDKKLVSEEVIKEVKDGIILVGTKHKPEITESEITEEEVLEYKSITVYDKELPEGETRIQEGKNGIKVNVYKVTYSDGVEINRTLISSDITGPIDEIITIGTKVVEPEEPDTPVEPTEPTEPTEPEITEPTKPETPDVTEPEVTEPSKEEPSETEEPEVTQSEVIQPEVAQPSETEETQPSEDSEPSQGEPKPTQPTNNNSVARGQESINEPIHDNRGQGQPNVTQPVQPESTTIVEPKSTTVAEPESTTTSETEVTSKETEPITNKDIDNRLNELEADQDTQEDKQEVKQQSNTILVVVSIIAGIALLGVVTLLVIKKYFR